MSSYTEGQIHQLADRLEAAAWTAEDITKLGQSQNLAQFKHVLHSLAVVSYSNSKYIIDCDAAPSLPRRFRVEKHTKGGQLEWNPNRVKLYLSKYQSKRDDSISGKRLYLDELGRHSVLNACVLDFLLANPTLIPEEWKGKAVCFWGTIIQSTYESCGLYIPCLCWDIHGNGHADHRSFERHFHDNLPAAVLDNSI